LVLINQGGASGIGLAVETIGGTGINIVTNSSTTAALDASNTAGPAAQFTGGGIGEDFVVIAPNTNVLNALNVAGTTNGDLVSITQSGADISSVGLAINSVNGTALNVTNNSADRAALDVSNNGGVAAQFTGGSVTEPLVAILPVGDVQRALYIQGETTDYLAQISQDDLTGNGLQVTANAGTAINAVTTSNTSAAVNASNSGTGPAVTASNTNVQGVALELADGSLKLNVGVSSVNGAAELVLVNSNVINVTAGITPTAFTALAGVVEGQLIYVVNNTGANWVGSVLGNVNDGAAATIIYVGGTWVRVN